MEVVPVSIPGDNSEQKKEAVLSNEALSPKGSNLDENKEPEQPQISETFQDQGASYRSSIINMMNTIIGSGVLAIPLSVKNCGLIGTIIVLGLSIYLSLEGAKMLSAVSVYTKQDSFGFIGRSLGSSVVGYIGDFSMILFDMGVSVVVSRKAM